MSKENRTHRAVEAISARKCPRCNGLIHENAWQTPSGTTVCSRPCGKAWMEAEAFARQLALETKVKDLYGTSNLQIAAEKAGISVEELIREVRVDIDQPFGIGDTVCILTGIYSNMTGIVIEDLPESQSVQVHVRMRSKQTILTLPRAHLRFTDKAWKMDEVAPSTFELPQRVVTKLHIRALATGQSPTELTIEALKEFLSTPLQAKE